MFCELRRYWHLEIDRPIGSLMENFAPYSSWLDKAMRSERFWGNQQKKKPSNLFVALLPRIRFPRVSLEMMTEYRKNSDPYQCMHVSMNTFSMIVHSLHCSRHKRISGSSVQCNMHVVMQTGGIRQNMRIASDCSRSPHVLASCSHSTSNLSIWIRYCAVELWPN